MISQKSSSSWEFQQQRAGWSEALPSLMKNKSHYLMALVEAKHWACHWHSIWSSGPASWLHMLVNSWVTALTTNSSNNMISTAFYSWQGGILWRGPESKPQVSACDCFQVNLRTRISGLWKHMIIISPFPNTEVNSWSGYKNTEAQPGNCISACVCWQVYHIALGPDPANHVIACLP
jgi:hypothetical protein